MKQTRLKYQVIGFCTGLVVSIGFTLLGLKIDIKIISMYDYNPYGSFMLYLLCVGLITGWKVESRTTRELIRRNVEEVR